MVSLDFSVTDSFRPHDGPGIDSAPSENEYQEHFLRVKATGAWGWRPHHLHVLNVMEVWEPKPPGTLCATPGLLRYSFNILCLLLCSSVMVFPLTHHTHLHNYVAFVRRRNGRNLGMKQSSLGCRGALNRKVLPCCYCSCLKGYEISKGRE